MYIYISLVLHPSKIMLRILTKRLEGTVRDFISKTQFGFKKGCGTRVDVLGLRECYARRF